MSDRITTSVVPQDQTSTPTYATLADVPLYRQATPPQRALLEQDLARVVEQDSVPLTEYRDKQLQYDLWLLTYGRSTDGIGSVIARPIPDQATRTWVALVRPSQKAR